MRLRQSGRPHPAYCMSEKSRNVYFVHKRAPAAAWKTSPNLLHVRQIQECFCLPGKKRLRQPGRPQPACYMSDKSRNDLVAEKNVPTAAWKSSPSLLHVRRIQERFVVQKKARAAGWKTSPNLLYFKEITTHLLPEKKAPAAAWKTSPSLLHVRKSRNVFFVEQKKACGSLEDLIQLIPCRTDPGTLVLPERKRLRGWEDFTKLITCQTNPGMPSFVNKKTSATAGTSSPSLLHVINPHARSFHPHSYHDKQAWGIPPPRCHSHVQRKHPPFGPTNRLWASPPGPTPYRLLYITVLDWMLRCGIVIGGWGLALSRISKNLFELVTLNCLSSAPKL